ncbi:ArsR/SmtB family transcription factor [Kaarinaea lacus]
MVKYNNELLDATFGALSDPTRRAILARLSRGEAQVSELAEPFGMSLPAVSKHLRVLEKAKLITRQIDGRVHRLRINPKPLQSAQNWIEHYEKFWKQQLSSLETYLNKTVPKKSN